MSIELYKGVPFAHRLVKMATVMIKYRSGCRKSKRVGSSKLKGIDPGFDEGLNGEPPYGYMNGYQDNTSIKSLHSKKHTSLQEKLPGR